MGDFCRLHFSHSSNTASVACSLARSLPLDRILQSPIPIEMRILYLFTHSTDDPTTTTTAFLNAKGAVEAGHDVVMLGAGHAGWLAAPKTLENMTGYGVPPLKDIVAFLVEKGVEVHF